MGSTADELLVAAQQGASPLQNLIAAGADVNAADKDGNTAAILASRNGHTDALQALIAAGADVNAANKYGSTAAILASLNGHTDALQGAEILSPLMAASYEGRRALLAALRKYDEAALGHIAATHMLRSSEPSHPQLALLQTLGAVERAIEYARSLRASDPASADTTFTLAMRLQLVAAAHLQSQRDEEVDAFFRGGRGVEALGIALRCEAKVFTMQPVVQRSIKRMWYGPVLSRLSKGAATHPVLYPVVLLVLVLGNALALPLLPCCAVYPPLAKWLTTNKSGNPSTNSLYLLATPVAKFALAYASDLALALLLTFPATPTLARPKAWAPLLVWLVASVVRELRQLSGGRSGGFSTLAAALKGYWADRFNRLDATALPLAITALAAAATDAGDVAADGAPSPHTRTLRMLAAFFLWARLTRVLLVLPSFGPYVLMVFTMINDVLKFLALLAMVILAFAAALFSLSEQGPSIRQQDVQWPPFLDSEAACFELGQTFPGAILYLLEHALAGNEFFECVRQSTHPGPGWVLALTFYTIAGLLLLNMLIAMSARAPPACLHGGTRKGLCACSLVVYVCATLRLLRRCVPSRFRSPLSAHPSPVCSVAQWRRRLTMYGRRQRPTTSSYSRRWRAPSTRSRRSRRRSPRSACCTRVWSSTLRAGALA